jgi:hypothetical protein
MADQIINLNERHRLTAHDVQQVLNWAGMGQFLALVVRNEMGLQLVVNQDEPELREPLRKAVEAYAARARKGR